LALSRLTKAWGAGGFCCAAFGWSPAFSRLNMMISCGVGGENVGKHGV
jgi:hypothetical protein